MVKKFDKPILVTETYLPDKKKFEELTNKLWESKWITNNGFYHTEFANKLQSFLRAPNLTLFNNGTLALDIAVKAMGLHGGEIITTPFTFVATPHVIALNNNRPIFCDIEPYTYNIDPTKIEALINEKTLAIMPVHVFGNPCNIDKIQDIANKFNLKVIYDAAHAFNVEINNMPITNFGDMSMLSFHSTKVFHTIEGGALIYPNDNFNRILYLYKNFGIENEEIISLIGTNAKMNELQAIMGLLNLDLVKQEVEKRQAIVNLYRDKLSNIAGLHVLNDIPGVKHNYSYFPILIDEKQFGMNRNKLYEELKLYNVFTRKYFYPLCSNILPYKNVANQSLETANYVAERIMTLPLYGNLELEKVGLICEIINSLRR